MWTNVDQDVWHHMASLGHNELTGMHDMELNLSSSMVYKIQQAIQMLHSTFTILLVLIVLKKHEFVLEKSLKFIHGLKYKPRINSLWPSDATWWHKSEATLAYVMACCLTELSHYLNQFWIIISQVHWHSFEGKFTNGIPAINNYKISM